MGVSIDSLKEKEMRGFLRRLYKLNDDESLAWYFGVLTVVVVVVAIIGVWVYEGFWDHSEEPAQGLWREVFWTGDTQEFVANLTALENSIIESRLNVADHFIEHGPGANEKRLQRIGELKELVQGDLSDGVISPDEAVFIQTRYEDLRYHIKPVSKLGYTTPVVLLVVGVFLTIVVQLVNQPTKKWAHANGSV